MDIQSELSKKASVRHEHINTQGTWTPTLLSGTCTASNCVYTKIGKLVTISGEITHSGNGSGATGVTINNIPYPCATSAYGFAGYWGIALDGTDKQAGCALTSASPNNLLFVSFPAASGIDASRWLAGSYLVFNVTYLTT